ncbi:ABC transporter substrate-binding protein [Corynebacterium belfantii]|uniref:ABC transporter substrate-binding protein n=1 Tax=Corynebacterium belfantii TaxID=2014537 RepID=UPI0018D3FAA4|nr:ABC transporter substrate-binding protein [Corynebacterium belfantii]MBG9243999.1 ABC transporter substrate-binding protein [Corynebacterium belfantii]
MTSDTIQGAPRQAGLRRALAPLVVLALALSLTACGSSADDRPASGQQPGGFPISVTHAHGETVIPSTPERVVVLGGSAEDAVAALGVVPVAVPEEYGTPDGYTDWFREHVTVELGAELPPVLSPGKDGVYDPEEILSYAPDLIFAPYSGITEAEYQQLSDIAPTIAYARTPWTYGSWSDIVELAGTALGRSDQAAELISRTQAAVDSARDAHAQLEGRSFIFGEWLEDGSSDLAVYSPDDPRPTLLREFGMTDDPSVAQEVGSFGEDYYGSVSLERLDALTTDVFIGWSNSREKIAQTLAHPLMSRWAPIAEGRYYYLEDPELLIAVTTPSVLSVPWAIQHGFLDDITSALEADAMVRTGGE